MGERGEQGQPWYGTYVGAGAAATEAWEAVTTSIEPTTGLLWAEVRAAAAVGGGTAAAAAVVVGEGAAVVEEGPGLDPPIRGGEKSCIRGLKLCPPRIFTMAGLENKRRWRGWEEEERIKNEFEMKLKRGGGGVVK